MARRANLSIIHKGVAKQKRKAAERRSLANGGTQEQAKQAGYAAFNREAEKAGLATRLDGTGVEVEANLGTVSGINKDGDEFKARRKTIKGKPKGSKVLGGYYEVSDNPTHWIGQIVNEKNEIIAQTGRCLSREDAYENAVEIIEQMREADSYKGITDRLYIVCLPLAKVANPQPTLKRPKKSRK